MGGCTLSVIAENKAWALAEIERKILGAAEGGLWVDSELVLLQEGADEAELYKCHLEYDMVDEYEADYGVRFERVEEGRAFHVGVAAMYTRPLKPGEWIATVHVHT